MKVDQPRRGYLDAPWGQVHYRRMGSGLPLLLLHQSPLSSVQFAAVQPQLASSGFDTFAIDMPGFGLSDELAESARLDDYADVVDAALDHAGWREASLVGHHTGAVIGACHAARANSRLNALVLNGFPLLTDDERAHFRSFRFAPPQLAADGSQFGTAWAQRLRSTPGWDDLARMQRYTVEALYRADTNWRLFPVIIEADLDIVLRQIHTRTLLLTNTGDDIHEATKRVRAVRPDFAYTELVGGTHDIIDEQPEAWTRAVSDFLGRGTQGTCAEVL